MRLLINFTTKAILLTPPLLPLAVNIEFKLGRTAIRLHNPMNYPIPAFRRLADRHGVKLQIIEIDELCLGHIKVDHKYGLVLADQVEPLADEITNRHLPHKPQLNVEDLAENQKGLDPVNRLVVLVGVGYFAVPEDGPHEQQHHSFDNGVFVEVDLDLVFLGTVAQNVDELHHQLLHLVAAQLHVLVGQARHCC
jgi:hypothetical protein